MTISTEGLRPADVRQIRQLVERLRLLAALETPQDKKTATTSEIYTRDYNRLDALSRSRALTEAESKQLAFTLAKLKRLGKTPA